MREQLLAIGNASESHAISAENESFSFEIREALVGKGRRGSYRAIFTVAADTVVVLRVIRSSQGALRPSDIVFPE